MGYGSSHEVYSSKIWEFSEKTPLVVEIVDEPVKVDKFLDAIKPFCEKSGKGLIITVDETTIAIHKIGAKK